MTRLLDRKLLALLSVFLLAAVLIWRWSDENVLTPSTEDAEQTANTPDAFVTNGRYRTFREDGQLSSVLVSRRAVHYPKDNTGHLETPRIQVFTEDGQPWHIESEQGILELDSDLAILRENVQVRTVDANQQPTTLQTEQLTLNNRTRFITTDQPVKMTSLRGEVTAVGMDAHVDEERMVLKSNVKGTYAPASP